MFFCTQRHFLRRKFAGYKLQNHGMTMSKLARRMAGLCHFFRHFGIWNFPSNQWMIKSSPFFFFNWQIPCLEKSNLNGCYDEVPFRLEILDSGESKPNDMSIDEHLEAKRLANPRELGCGNPWFNRCMFPGGGCTSCKYNLFLNGTHKR